MLYKLLIKPILFLFKPEFAHKIVFTYLKLITRIPIALKLLNKMYSVENASLEREVFGIKFKNPVGIAAGLDKDAEVFDVLGSLGFSHVEVGTITPRPQDGNPKERLFRVVKDQALINRMGFNNKGVERAIKNLRKKHTNIVIGGNIGKNKITSNEEAYLDYKACFESLFPYVDYFAINISSPNTPKLRELLDQKPLKHLLQELSALNKAKETPKPLLLKISPDVGTEQLDSIIDVVQEVGIDGIIATNTTISRENLLTDDEVITKIGNGGLSGKPLTNRSTEIIRHIHKKTNGEIPIVGVGGIMTPEDALEKIKAGATLLQIYSGFIYNGPKFVSEINKKLILELNKN